MNDMSHVIIPKSDQINADDLISGPMTITIESVQIKGGQEQPVSIYFAGSDKAFRPCKSMSRVLVAAWGPDANKYVGRSLTLYRDPKVKWGGMEVGGIRISHMSHIDRDMVMALTATKGRRDPFKVRPMVDAPAAEPPKQDRAKEGTLALMRRIQAENVDVDTILAEPEVDKQRAYLASKRPELAKMLDKAIAVARAQANDDPFADQPAANPGAPEPPQQSDEQAGSDSQDATDEHPAVPVANRLMQRIKACELLADLNTLVNDAKDTLAAFPDDIAETVGGLIERRRAALKGVG